MLKFDKEVTKAKMLKYIIMNFSYESLVAQLYVNKNISPKPGALLMLGTWWFCN